MASIVSLVLGALLVMIGIAFIPTPLPIGAGIIAMGVFIMVAASPTARGFLRRTVEKNPSLKRVLPRKILEKLNE